MKKYVRHFGTVTPQFQRAAPDQVQNKAGGWVFPVTDEVQFERFLAMGTAENTFYQKAPELTREAILCLDRLIENGQGPWAVNKIEEISVAGRAPKQDPALFALGAAIKIGDLDTRRAAALAVPRIARTGTHFFQFLEAVRAFSRVKGVADNGTPIQATGWGRVVDRAVHGWLASKSNDQLAYQMVKYRQREGWEWKDVLRKAKPAGRKIDSERDGIFGWATGKGWGTQPLPDIIYAFADAQQSDSESEIIRLIHSYRLPWEAVPSRWARNLEVQAALFETMPIDATIRQLGRLSNLGLLAPGSDATKAAIARITNPEQLKRGRIHPMALYVAEETYAVGRGIRGQLTWTPAPEIVDALGQAYFQALTGTVEPSGKNIVIGVDISGSMHAGGVMGLPEFLVHEAAFASALALARIEPNAIVTTFDTVPRMLRVPPIETLRQLKDYARGAVNRGGGTDCSQPIIWAHQNVHDVDAFVIFTDHESWRGTIHPVEALWQYRQKWGRPTKLVTQAFVPTGHAIGAGDDALYLDVAGMDDSVPGVIANFIR